MIQKNGKILANTKQSKIFSGNLITFSTDLPPAQIRGNHRSHFRTSITPVNRFRKCTKNERRVDVMVFDTTNYKNVSILADSDFLLML